MTKEHLVVIKPHAIENGLGIQALNILETLSTYGTLPINFPLADHFFKVLSLNFQITQIVERDLTVGIRDQGLLDILYPKIKNTEPLYPYLKLSLMNVVKIVVLRTSGIDWDIFNASLLEFRGSNFVVKVDDLGCERTLSVGSGLRGFLQGKLIASRIEFLVDTPFNQGLRAGKVLNNILHVPDTQAEVTNLIEILKLDE